MLSRISVYVNSLFNFFSGERHCPGLLAYPVSPTGIQRQETPGRDRLQRIGGDTGQGYPAPALFALLLGSFPVSENCSVKIHKNTNTI